MFIGKKTAEIVQFLAEMGKGKEMALCGQGFSETKAHRICLSFHARSFPYVPLALLPIHHISLWARQLSGAEAYSQFSSPSNCTKYSNSSVKLEKGVDGWEVSKRNSCVAIPCMFVWLGHLIFNVL